MATQINLPDLRVPGVVKNKSITLAFYLAANGALDSVGIEGLDNAKDTAGTRKAFKGFVGWAFNPARDKYGCPVPGKARETITFR